MPTKICNLISAVFLLALLMLAVLLAGPYILGMKTYAVLSGSMEPTLPVGGLIYVIPVQPESIETGDIVTLTLTGGTAVTHRVVGIDSEMEKLTTKGDANSAEDNPAGFHQLVGRVALTLPYLGYLAAVIQSRKGILLGTGVLLLLIILTFLPGVLKRDSNTNLP